jgi:hypothetical protein
VLRQRFPDAILVNEEDAAVLGPSTPSVTATTWSRIAGYRLRAPVSERLQTPSASTSELFFSVAAAPLLHPRTTPMTPSGDSSLPRPARHQYTYHPLPVVVATAEGAWVTDADGRRYLDCLAAYRR